MRVCAWLAQWRAGGCAQCWRVIFQRFFLTHASICSTTDKPIANGMPQSAVVAVKHGKPTWFPSETPKPSAMRRSVAKVEVRSAASEAKPAEWRVASCRFPGVNAKSTRRRGGITRGVNSRLRCFKCLLIVLLKCLLKCLLKPDRCPLLLP